jgi:hypothetical protein
MFVQPAPGRLVRDPVSKRELPKAGGEVPETSYWLRRLACGDVLEVVQIPIPDSKGEG